MAWHSLQSTAPLVGSVSSGLLPDAPAAHEGAQESPLSQQNPDGREMGESREQIRHRKGKKTPTTTENEEARKHSKYGKY